MEADRERWDQRWADAAYDPTSISPTPPDVITAHPALLRALPSTGAGLDLACGLGAQSLWMATLGLDVTALDVSPVAISAVDTAAAASGYDIQAQTWDTDSGLPVGLTGMAMIVCQRYRATDLYTELVRRLRPGGVLILTVLSAVGLASEPGPFHAPAGELTITFAGVVSNGTVEVLADDERDGQASIVLRRATDNSFESAESVDVADDHVA